MSPKERRKHRRLEIRLPLECSCVGAGPISAYRTVTLNVSTGGLYFETEATDIKPGMLLKIELTVPPGDGHFPYQGRVTGLGEVVRVVQLPPRTDLAGRQRQRMGVATRFKENLKLSF
ncbi:MAG: PilZ domain-containing protein [Phycisphaerae bacterium]